MTSRAVHWSSVAERRSRWLEAAPYALLAPFLDNAPVLNADPGEPQAADNSQGTVLALFRLQQAADYRAALRAWFRPVRIGGHLLVVVPHAFLHERQLALPSRWDEGQRRLYTPRSLLEEVEEALVPNSYRVRHLSDLDEGYDYARASDDSPVGQREIVLVLEKIAVPSWELASVSEERAPAVRPTAPDYAFEPARTRVELTIVPAHRRVLILKLDHLGDFVMALAALERARALFAGAEITLVVGSWNVDMARGLGVADHVIAFDAFPRNSSEEAVDVRGKAALFQAAITQDYDIAIDLRIDGDTRFLLDLASARLRAGIGSRSLFPYLDIFLPIDATRHEPEMAREDVARHHAFAAQASVTRGEHRLVASAAAVARDCAIIWGPYWPLRPGRYLFEPYIEIAPGGGGLLVLDVALDAVRVAHELIEYPRPTRLAFTVATAGARFEFRVHMVDDAPAQDFSFFGGRLIREGAASVLHQSEYMVLLIELIALRIARGGILADAKADAGAA